MDVSKDSTGNFTGMPVKQSGHKGVRAILVASLDAPIAHHPAEQRERGHMKPVTAFTVVQATSCLQMCSRGTPN